MSTSDFTSRVTPTGAILTTTAQTTVYTTRKTFDNLIGINIANITAAPVTVTVGWYDAHDTVTYYLCYQYPVAANGIFIPEPRGMCLDEGDEIRITAGTANALHCIVLTVEIAGRAS